MVVVSMCEASGEVPVFWRDEEDEQLHQSGLVCNFDYLQGPGCKIWMYCAVFSLLIYVASLSRKKKKCDVGFNTSKRQQQQVTSTNTPLLRPGPVHYLVLACDNVSSLVWSTMNTILHLTTFTSY